MKLDRTAHNLVGGFTPRSRNEAHRFETAAKKPRREENGGKVDKVQTGAKDDRRDLPT